MPGIDRVIGGPTVVSGPGKFTALKQQIAGAVITDNEDDVTLQVFSLGSQLPKVDATQPILGDLEFDCWFPLAFAHIVVTDGRVRLRGPLKRIKTLSARLASSRLVSSMDLPEVC